MAKLKYSLFELNENILFTIYEQDERFRAKGEGICGEDICFEASNRAKVHSHGYPQIALCNNKTVDIYLRGRCESEDNGIAALNLKDIDITPQALIKNIDSALKEWAEKWEGWKEELPSRDEIVGVRIKEV